MTLTTHRPARKAATPSRPVESQPTTSPEQPCVVPRRVLDDVYRVECDGRVAGYVQVVGRVFVTLQGPVYNTSVEIAQCLDLDTAVSRLARALNR